MKRNLRYLFTLLFAIVCANTLWAEDKTYDFRFNTIGTDGWANSYAAHSLVYDECTVSFEKASKQTQTIADVPVTKGLPVSLVMNDGYTLSAVTFNCKQWGSKAQTITLHYSTDGGDTYTSTGITSSNFTISSDNLPSGTNAVKITFSSTSNQIGIESATITYSNGGGSETPSITADNVNIAYDATAGSIAYTLANTVDDGVLTASTTADWLEIGTVGETVPFTTTANEAATARTATVTLTYTYNDPAETVTKDVTVTQAGNPNVIPTIAEVRTQGTGSVVTKGVVTSCVGTTAYIQDATAAICVYGSDNLTVGDEVRVTGTLSTYKGLLEITSPDVTVLSSGKTVAPTVMTIEEVNESTNQGWLVKIEDATVTNIDGQNTTIAQGENTIVVRGISGVDYAVNDVLTLTGNIGCFNTAQIANPTNVTVQEVVVPTITVNPATVNVTADGGDGEITVTYQNITDVMADVIFYEADGTTLATYDWIDAEINDATNNVEYVIDANDGDARTAYLKVYSIDDEGGDVYSELVTITQAKYVVDYATLPFSFDGGKADIEDTNGLTQDGLDNDYGKSPYLKFNGANDYVVLKVNEAIGFVAFDITGNGGGSNAWAGTFKVQASEDGNDYTDIATFTYPELGPDAKNVRLFDIDSNVRYIKWVYVQKTTGNVGLGNIVVNGVLDNVTVAVAAAGQGLATFASDYRLDFTGLDVEAYIAKQDGEKIALQQVNKVPAGTGVLLRSLGGTEFTVPTTTEDAEAVTGNLFVRGNGDEVATEVVENETVVAKNYVLSINAENVVGFFWAEGKEVPLNKAYLQVPAGASAPAAIYFDFETTGIKAVDNNRFENGAIYDLQGRRVANPTRGLYIVNGKKVVLK